MLEYGETFIAQNRETLEHLEAMMTPAGYAVALEMAPAQDAFDFEDEEPIAA